MRILIMLAVFIFSSSLSNKTFAQINFSGCDELDLKSSYTLNAAGTVTDNGIDRTVFESDATLGNYGEAIIIKWDPATDQWNIFHNNFDGGDGPQNELLFSSSVATYPNPPNLSVGNWTNDGAEHTCEPIGELSGDVQGLPSTVNQDPTVTGLPSEVTVEEDSTTDVFDISAALVSDVDAGSGELTLTLTATGGIFDIASGSGVSLIGHLTNQLKITANLTDLNHYINIPSNIYFRPSKNLSGNSAWVDVSINDNGNTGSGGGTDIFIGTVMVNITSVNDAPLLFLPSSISVTEGVATSLEGISFSDVDAESGNVTVSMGVGSGTLSGVSGGGVTISGSGSSAVQIQGSVADLNAYIAGGNLRYLNQIGNTADQTLSVTINDHGFTGSGGALEAAGTLTLLISLSAAEVTSVTVPANGTYGEGEFLDFSVNFDKEAVVDASGGTPSLSLNIGTSTEYADYLSGSGSTLLVFRYIVQQGDEDYDGITLNANALTLNGGTIQNQGVDVNLTLQNIGSTAGVLVDAVAPSGYSVFVDQAEINATNQTAVSFTLAGAEVGTNYTYTFSSSEGGTNVSGSGTITSANQQISGIDLSGLNSGTITLTLTLEDVAANVGVPATTTVDKIINEAPLAVEDQFSTDVNLPLTGNVLTNDSDPNLDALLASLVTAPVNGIVVLNADGSFTYTPNADYVGIDSLMYQACDNGIPSLCDTAMVRFNVIDTAIPSGYSVAWADDFINESEANATTLTVANAAVGTTLNYTLSSSGDGNTNTITGSEPVSDSSMDFIVDVSGLDDGTLTAVIFLTSVYGTPGMNTSDNSAILDKTAPSGYTVNIDQDPIDRSNQGLVSFSFLGAELGATYNYSFTSQPAGPSVTGSGTITSANEQISGIDLTTLADGTVTLSVSLEDTAGNTGNVVTDIANKQINTAPTAGDVAVQGTLVVGQQLIGAYSYSDPDGDLESGSTFIWYRSDNASGAGKTEISGAVSNQYTLQTIDRGKYISFEVTPNDGTIAGSVVESAIVGPVKMEQMIVFPAIEVKTYGDAAFVLGDAYTDQGLVVTYTTADPSVVSILGNQATILKAGVTSITATQGGDSQTNPAAQVTQTLTVDMAILSVTTDATSKTYGATDPTFTYQVSGFVNGDDESSLTGTLGFSRVAGESVGTYGVTASGYLSDNYTINYIDGSLEITPASIVITVDTDLVKTYGTADPEFTFNASGFVNGDDVSIITGTLSRAPGEDVGIYPISLGSLSGGTNYELSLESADFEIIKADQEISWNQELSFSCSSDTQLSLTASSSSGLAVTYSVTDASIAEVNADVLSAKSSGTTTVIAQQSGDKNYNPASAIEKIVTVSQNGLIRQHWDDVLVFDNSSGDFVSFQWYKNGTAVAGATKQYYSENQSLNGSYYAQATTQSGEVITSCVLEINGEQFTYSLSLVPNPVSASSEFVVDCNFDQASLDGATISIIDLNGRLLQTVSVTDSQTSITAPTQRGVYIVVLNLADGSRKTINLLVN